MKHAKLLSGNTRPACLPHKAAWCEPYVDGFCYDIECQDGMKGIHVTGGIAGVNTFYPLLPCLKG